MGTAFPGLVGMVLGRTTLNDEGEGALEQLGLVVGWEDGYLVLLCDGGRMRKYGWADDTIVLGPGKVEKRSRSDEGIQLGGEVATA
jgi:hypothetical protein